MPTFLQNLRLMRPLSLPKAAKPVSKVPFFCQHLSDYYDDLSDLYADLSVIRVDLSEKKLQLVT